MILEILGAVPSKKNLLRVTRNGTYHDKAIADAIEALHMRTWIAWRQQEHPLGVAPVLVHPELTFTFHVNDRRSDRDNKLTTFLDVLQSAGVLKNDNINSCNARLVIEPAVLTKGEEKTVIEVIAR